MASYEKRDDGWSVRWRDPDGTNRRRQVPDATSRDRLVREIEAAQAEGRRWEPVARRNPAVVELVGEYLREMRRTWRPNTYESHSVSLSLFVAWVDRKIRRKHVGVEVLSKALVGEFWDHCREEREIGVNTANLRARSVEQFWAWCYDHDEHGTVTPRPRRAKLPGRQQSMTTAPTWEEMDAVIAAHTTTHYRRLCLLLRCTGLRKSQAFGLRWDDVDLAAGTLRVRPELGKTQAERRGRVVPLAPVLVAELAGWGRREGWLLPWPSPLRKAHNITLERAWVRAGVPGEGWRGRTAHAFRKGFVTGLRALGADRDAVEFLVGHSLGLPGVYTDPRAYSLVSAVALVPAVGTNVVRLQAAECP